MKTTLARMRQLIGTSPDWQANDIVIGDGEIAIQKDAGNAEVMKIGDGVRRYSQLPPIPLYPQTISTQSFHAAADGVTDDSIPLMTADAVAVAAGLPLLIKGVLHIATPVTIKAMMVDVRSQLFTPTSKVTIDNGMELRPEWWGADPTNGDDSLAAWVALIAVAKGRVARVGGMYKMSGALAVDYNDAASLKIVGGGSSLLDSPGLAYNRFGFNFDTVPAGSKGLDIQKVRGLVLEDFFVSYRPAVGDGVAVHLRAFDNFSIKGVGVDHEAGPGSAAIRFGETDGSDCVFMGNVRNVKVLSNDRHSLDIRSGCTSLTVESFYQLRGFVAIANAQYCTFISCGSEGSPLYAYNLNGSRGITFVECAGEQNQRGVFYLQSNCQNITFINPLGIANNKSGIAGVGDLIHLDPVGGGNGAITIINPTSLNSHANTTNAIYSAGVNGAVSVENVTAANLAKGIGGDGGWQQSLLTVSGAGESRVFTPTLNAGWTNVGVPTVTGRYVVKGKTIFWWIDITPSAGGSIKSNGAGSRILIPWGFAAGSTAGVVDGNAAGYVAATVANAQVFVPVTPVLTVPLTVSGVGVLP